MKLIIQIPAFNEAETLEIALNDLPKQIEGLDTIEYLIIDDGSSDATVAVARAWGVQHIVRQRRNKGLAKGFMAGMDACLRLGADIIVNTDADNQYNGADIEKLVRPILDKQTDIVIGERPIMETIHFSSLKKQLQRFGSFVVRKASKTEIKDAPSGFRAYSRYAAMRLNVTNAYTYTLETIVQAGRDKIAMIDVPIRTNAELRPSRLFSSMGTYVKRSMGTILRAYMTYQPMKFFTYVGLIPFVAGLLIGLRYVYYALSGTSGGHIQSLILSAILLLIGFMTIVIGFVAELISINRKILEDIEVRVRRLDYHVNSEDEKMD